MNPYLKITARTFTIWILSCLINALLCVTSLSVIQLNYEATARKWAVILFISLIFSAPGFFVFWLVLVFKFSNRITERALFRSALITGFLLASITAFFGVKIFSREFNNHAAILAACIMVSAVGSIMLHFNHFKKIK